jgi:hypothetical protein
VFTKLSFCEREDFHVCGGGGGFTFGKDFEDKSFCLQVTLRLPRFSTESGNNPTTNGIKCTGWNYGEDDLWAVDSIGRITIWKVPETGFDFVPKRSWRAHKAAITCFDCTWKHAITGSDDGYIMLHDLVSMNKIRSLDITETAFYYRLIPDNTIRRRVKSLWLSRCSDSEPGSLAVGTSTGDAFILSTGYCM